MKGQKAQKGTLKKVLHYIRPYWALVGLSVLLAAVTVGGGLFGLPGMILGVPVFAIIYAYTSGAINNKLREKEMPTDTLVYEDFSKYHIDKEEIFGKERFEAARRLGERDTKPAQRE